MIGKINATFKEGISEVRKFGSSEVKDQWMEECAAQEVILVKIFSDKRDWFLENASSEFRQEQGDNDYEEKNRRPAIGPKGEVSQRKEDHANGGCRSADETSTRQDFWPDQQQNRKHNWHAPRNWKRTWNNRGRGRPNYCRNAPTRRNRSQSRSQNRRDVRFEVGAITAEHNVTNLNAQEEVNGINHDQENEEEGRRNDGNNNFLCHAQGAMNNNNH